MNTKEYFEYLNYFSLNQLLAERQRLEDLMKRTNNKYTLKELNVQYRGLCLEIESRTSKFKPVSKSNS